MVGDSTLVQPTPGGPDLAALATFTVDQAGRLDSWSRPAERLFSRLAAEVLGRHVCDVLLTGPGQRDLIDRALADALSGALAPARPATLDAACTAVTQLMQLGEDDITLVLARISPA